MESGIIPGNRGSRVVAEEEAVDNAQTFAKQGCASWKEYIARFDKALKILTPPPARCETVLGMAAVRP